MIIKYATTRSSIDAMRWNGKKRGDNQGAIQRDDTRKQHSIQPILSSGQKGDQSANRKFAYFHFLMVQRPIIRFVIRSILILLYFIPTRTRIRIIITQLCTSFHFVFAKLQIANECKILADANIKRRHVWSFYDVNINCSMCIVLRSVTFIHQLLIKRLK